jgi:hypothetical protein
VVEGEIPSESMRNPLVCRMWATGDVAVRQQLLLQGNIVEGVSLTSHAWLPRKTTMRVQQAPRLCGFARGWQSGGNRLDN